MRSRYPRFRQAQAAPGPFGRHRPAAVSRPRLPFAAALTGGCALVFAATWFATPMLQQLWPDTAASIAEPESATPARPVYYSGCSEARAAGAAPLMRGSPGYRPEMDRDDDGIACETWSSSSSRPSWSHRLRRGRGRRH